MIVNLLMGKKCKFSNIVTLCCNLSELNAQDHILLQLEHVNSAGMDEAIATSTTTEDRKCVILVRKITSGIPFLLKVMVSQVIPALRQDQHKMLQLNTYFSHGLTYSHFPASSLFFMLLTGDDMLKPSVAAQCCAAPGETKPPALEAINYQLSFIVAETSSFPISYVSDTTLKRVYMYTHLYFEPVYTDI